MNYYTIKHIVGQQTKTDCYKTESDIYKATTEILDKFNYQLVEIKKVDIATYYDTLNHYLINNI